MPNHLGAYCGVSSPFRHCPQVISTLRHCQSLWANFEQLWYQLRLFRLDGPIFMFPTFIERRAYSLPRSSKFGSEV
jgi:hypothetical protein